MPFLVSFLSMTNGENTAFIPIKEYLLSRGFPGYVGYQSDSEVFAHIMTLGEELPYSTAVVVENWDETSKPGLVKIQADILVTRESHKPMVIGKGGERLKDIGQKARIEIEAMLESKVFLELWVKVRRDWTDDPALLRDLGLGQ